MALEGLAFPRDFGGSLLFPRDADLDLDFEARTFLGPRVFPIEPELNKEFVLPPPGGSWTWAVRPRAFPSELELNKEFVLPPPGGSLTVSGIPDLDFDFLGPRVSPLEPELNKELVLPPPGGSWRVSGVPDLDLDFEVCLLLERCDFSADAELVKELLLPPPGGSRQTAALSLVKEMVLPSPGSCATPGYPDLDLALENELVLPPPGGSRHTSSDPTGPIGWHAGGSSTISGTSVSANAGCDATASYSDIPTHPPTAALEGESK